VNKQSVLCDRCGCLPDSARRCGPQSIANALPRLGSLAVLQRHRAEQGAALSKVAEPVVGLAALVGMGFDRAAAVRALERSGGDAGRAAEWLLDGGVEMAESGQLRRSLPDPRGAVGGVVGRVERAVALERTASEEARLVAEAAAEAEAAADASLKEVRGEMARLVAAGSACGGAAT
jgi:hypothetical protein